MEHGCLIKNTTYSESAVGESIQKDNITNCALLCAEEDTCKGFDFSNLLCSLINGGSSLQWSDNENKIIGWCPKSMCLFSFC